MSDIKKCEICNEAPSKYNCPKCDILFCSVKCYKDPTHSSCSEQFYQNCVKEEMKLRASEASEAQKSKDEIAKILERSATKEPDVEEILNGADSGDEFDDIAADEDEQEDSDDDKEDDDLTKRFEGVNLDDPDLVWSKLTDEEKKKFEELLETGEIVKVLPTFEPWWECQVEKKRIVDISKEDEDEKHKFCHPEIIENIIEFSAITKKPPSDCVFNNLTNVLAAYVYIVRYYHGEYYTMESAIYLLNISLNLKANANFDDTEQAIHSVIYECTILSLPTTPDAHKAIKADLNQLFEGRYKGGGEKVYVLAALSDLHKVFSDAFRKIKNCKNVESAKWYKDLLKMQLPDTFENPSKLKLKIVLKKIDYYLSYGISSYFTSLGSMS